MFRSESAKEFRQNRGTGEDNWKSRQTFCASLSDAIEKHGKDRLPYNFTEQVEPFLNNMLDCAISERTTLSIQGCRVLGNIPKVLGRDMHPHLDRILPVLIKMCASSKSVAQKASSQTISNIITYSTYSPRLLWHVCQAFEEKVTGPKVFAPAWIQLILKEYHKSMHPDRDFDSINRALSLGLEDADVTVRTNTRGAYWIYSKVDPNGAQNIMEKLNNHARTALQNDPNNPDKKHADKKSKAPPRPGSALSEIREQAKKQRAQEKAAQQNQKTFTSSTASEDQTSKSSEPAEQRSVKERKEKPLPPPPPPETEKQHFSKSASRPTVHKKALSQDSESAKSAPSSRGLLSAPVRRPRIVATPMNGPQTSRPNSRTGQVHQTKDSQKDSRPNSSSSAKAAITSPPAKPMSPPRTRPVHVPEGKENAGLYSSSKSKPSPPIPRATQHSPPKRPQSATSKIPPAHDLPAQALSLDHESAPRLAPIPATPRAPLQAAPIIVPQTASRPSSSDYDLNSAKRYLDVAMRHLQLGTLDPLGYRKLKNIIDQHNQNLFDDRTKYDELFGELLARLHSTDELAGDEGAKVSKNPTYNKQTTLQIVIPLVLCFPQWAHKWLTPTISAIILYRCTLPIDGTDRRSLIAVQVVDAVVNVAGHPLDLVDSVTAALQIGEEVILSKTQQPPTSNTPELAHAVFSAPATTTQSETGKGSAGSTEEAVAHMRSYMVQALNSHPLSTQSDLPKKLPLLMEFGLNTLIAVLNRVSSEGLQIDQNHADDLGLIANHCFKSYDYVIKRAVVPYCQALFRALDNEQQFFGYFSGDEGTVNLLEYYVASVRKDM